tara:strand:+ start:147 stop:554 length:408 start_codon:yes stop_codon:yes gene_type:complete
MTAWLHRTRDVPKHFLHTASFYLIPFLLMMAYAGDHSLKPVAAIVFVFGLVETTRVALLPVQRRNIGNLLLTAAFALHIAVYLPYVGKPPGNLYRSTLLLLCILLTYAALDTWPYNMSPLVSTVFGLTVITLTYT